MNLKNLKEKINNHIDFDFFNYIKENKKKTIAIMVSACIIGCGTSILLNAYQQKLNAREQKDVFYCSKIYAQITDTRTDEVVLRVNDIDLQVETNKRKLKDGQLSLNFISERDVPIRYIYLTLAVFDQNNNQIADNGKYIRTIRCKPTEVINNFYQTDEFLFLDLYDLAKVEVAIDEILYEDGTRFVLNSPAISSVKLSKEQITIEPILKRENINEFDGDESIGEKL